LLSGPNAPEALRFWAAAGAINGILGRAMTKDRETQLPFVRKGLTP